ncbi:MAG: filamentous hemagglutinin N-terminal domain-containing protein, partial [Candidatus Omnitrophota bacterium]
MKNSRKFRMLNKVVSVLTLLSFIIHPIALGKVWAESPLPQGPTVQSGSVTFNSPNEVTLNVEQMSEASLIDWLQFCIAHGYTVNFNMPGSNSFSVNRVTGGDISHIFGTLHSNGIVWLLNPSGIVFGAGSKIDTASFLGSTLTMSKADFDAKTYFLVKDPAKANGYIVSQGEIKTNKDGGYVALLGGAVRNEGLIEARMGKVILASGEKMAVELDGAGTISVAVNGPVSSKVKDENNNDVSDAVVNAATGKIAADGGIIVLTADVLKDVFTNAVNNEGVLQANSLQNVNGQIYLKANDKANVAGQIDADTGTVTVDSQRLDYSGKVNAADAFFNANDGDTTITAADSGNGNKTFTDNGNITVAGNFAVTNGRIRIFADNDNTGGGNFIQNTGTTISNTGGSSIAIRSGSDETHGTGNVTVGTINSSGNVHLSAFGGSISR